MSHRRKSLSKPVRERRGAPSRPAFGAEMKARTECPPSCGPVLLTRMRSCAAATEDTVSTRPRVCGSYHHPITIMRASYRDSPSKPAQPAERLDGRCADGLPPPHRLAPSHAQEGGQRKGLSAETRRDRRFRTIYVFSLGRAHHHYIAPSRSRL